MMGTTPRLLRSKTTILSFLLCIISSMMLLRISAFTGSRMVIGKRCSSIRTATTATTALFSTAANADAPSAVRQQQQQQQQQQRPKTGGLRRLPVVKAPSELMSTARKVAYRIKADKEVKNARQRARKHGAETINALTQSLCLPLRVTVNGYKNVWNNKLHPFERVVADLTSATAAAAKSPGQKKGGLTLTQILGEIHEARKMLLEAGKDWISKVKNAATAKEAGEAMQEGTESLLALFQTHAGPSVVGLVELQRSLRSAPIVQLDTPAVVLVGSPNVGKSSIVRAISSATPEVNNYPFTTRGMTLGHVEVFWSSSSSSSSSDATTTATQAGATMATKAVVPDPRRRPGSSSPPSPLVTTGKYAFSQLCQVMDSPGLLVRPDEERNEMEALTLAAMQHLPTAVCYVMDLSGGAGDKCSSVSDQLALRREVRSRFPRRPWIDVVSKFDLGVVEGSLEGLEEILRLERQVGNDGTTAVPPPYIRLSIHDGTGVDELRAEILRMLGEVRIVLDAMAAINDNDSDSSSSRPSSS